MSGDPANVHVYVTGDVYVFNPAVSYVSATHLPADLDAPLHASWLPAGLMLGDPGVEMPRDIEKTDLNAWQKKRFKTTYKNAKKDARFTLFEDNAVTDDLIDEENVPSQKPRRLACVFVGDDGYVKRMFTKTTADLWVTAENHKEDPDGYPVEVSLYPDSTGAIWTVQKGIPA
jgi:hypothetical protein